MKTITYKITYSGPIVGRAVDDEPSEEIVRVYCQDINSGYTKALKQAKRPLGSGRKREIARIEFWEAY